MLALIRFVASQNKICEVTVSTSTICADNPNNGNAVQKVNKNLKELNILLVKNFNTVKKDLRNRGLHLNEHGTSRLAMNNIATIRKL